MKNPETWLACSSHKSPQLGTETFKRVLIRSDFVGENANETISGTTCLHKLIRGTWDTGHAGIKGTATIEAPTIDPPTIDSPTIDPSYFRVQKLRLTSLFRKIIFCSELSDTNN